MKKFISGLIVGVVLSASFMFSFANVDEIKAVFSNFNFLVNGESAKLESQPLVYNGASYLPVREIANMLGYDVTYKTETKTVEFNFVSVPNSSLTEYVDDSQDHLINEINNVNDYLKKSLDIYNKTKKLHTLITNSESHDDISNIKNSFLDVMNEIDNISVIPEEYRDNWGNLVEYVNWVNSLLREIDNAYKFNDITTNIQDEVNLPESLLKRIELNTELIEKYESHFKNSR